MIYPKEICSIHFSFYNNRFCHLKEFKETFETIFSTLQLCKAQGRNASNMEVSPLQSQSSNKRKSQPERNGVENSVSVWKRLPLLADKDKRKIWIAISTAGTLSSATKESADIQIYKLDKYFMSFWASSVRAQ
jgi:hypothetical protein